MEKCLKAKDISVSLLYPLIPVEGPVFFDKNDETRKCISLHISWENSGLYDEPLVPHNFSLIDTCVCQAREEGWEYILGIYLHEGKYFVRGC